MHLFIFTSHAVHKAPYHESSFWRLIYGGSPLSYEINVILQTCSLKSLTLSDSKIHLHLICTVWDPRRKKNINLDKKYINWGPSTRSSIEQDCSVRNDKQLMCKKEDIIALVRMNPWSVVFLYWRKSFSIFRSYIFGMYFNLLL